MASKHRVPAAGRANCSTDDLEEMPAHARRRERSVVLTRTRIQVPHVRAGRAGYRWETGYFVNNQYPALPREQAHARTHQLGGRRWRSVTFNRAAGRP